MRCQKLTEFAGAAPIITKKYTTCHDDEDGKVEYYQGVPKAQKMRRTSPLMYKEEVRHIFCAFEACL
jgi:hypothetical protein